MKKSLLILMGLSMSYFLVAQEITKQKEIGLAFNNLDNFGLTYKTGTNRSLWRFNTLFLSGYNSEESADSLLNTQSNLGFGVKLGKEYRKEVIDNLEIRFGADLSFRYTHSRSEYNDKTVDDYDRLNERTTYQPGINLVFGFNYLLGDNFLIGAELLPGFSYSTGESVEKRYYITDVEETKSDISGFSYGLSNTSVLLSLAYRF